MVAELQAPVSDIHVRSHYSISQAAAHLGVSRVTIWRWIRAGRLPAARLGHRTTRIRREDLERLALSTGSPGAAPWAARGLVAIEPDADTDVADEAAHLVQFYESDGFLLDAVAAFFRDALAAGEPGILVATQSHREGVEDRLRIAGIDVHHERETGRFLSLDAAETLRTFMDGDSPDRERFMATIGALHDRAAAGGRRVNIFGEMVALLVAEGNEAAAVRLEQLWNELQQTRPFVLFCAYPMDQLGGETVSELFSHVCDEHSRVIPAESYTTLPRLDDRSRAIAALQQKAERLEAEIAERRRAEERLREALATEQAAREAAETAIRLRDEFLSVAAHELKTPLTTLSGQAQLVARLLQRDGQLSAERTAQALELITRQSNRLARLLGQLLDISRLEAGKLVLEWQPTDVALLVEQIVAATRPMSDRHTFVLTVPPTLEAWVDPLRLEQVLTNLIDNAVKYSPDGGTIQVELSAPRPGTFELSVRDHGLGIPEAQRDSIFERYYQAHANGHRSGMGLGLYICRQIVEMHGGQIRAGFPEDGGTRMTVSLPLYVEEPEMLPDAAG